MLRGNHRFGVRWTKKRVAGAPARRPAPCSDIVMPRPRLERPYWHPLVACRVAAGDVRGFKELEGRHRVRLDRFGRAATLAGFVVPPGPAFSATDYQREATLTA